LKRRPFIGQSRIRKDCEPSALPQNKLLFGRATYGILNTIWLHNLWYTKRKSKDIALQRWHTHQFIAVSRLVAKICLLGEFSVGKTSLVRRFVEGIFDERYLSTLGVKISRHALQIDQTDIDLIIWDTAGGEKLDQIVQNYYRGAAGALLVCDVTRPDTLPALREYATAFHQASPDTPLVIAANKIDLTNQRRIDDEEIASFAATLKAAWHATSARTGQGVSEAFQSLGQQIRQQRGRV